jgi:hypothetical protein
MKRILCAVALAALTVPAMAHNSVIPHSHTTNRDNSDAFIGMVAGLALLAVSVMLFRALRRSRRS